MAKSKTKQLAKRRMARIWQHLDEAVQMLVVEYGLFTYSHDDYAELLKMIAQQIMIVQSEIEDFWREAWGELPENMRSWT